MKFYIGASITGRLEYARELRSVIEAAIEGSKCTSRWLDIKPEQNGYLIKDKQEAFRHLSEWAKKDFNDLTDADTFILITGDNGSRGGKWTEYGIALACGLKCYILGPREGAFCYLEGTVQCDTVGALLTELTRQ